MKQIKNFPNYSINEVGEIYNKEGRKLKGSVDKKGYLHITLSNKGVKFSFLTHRLVATTFISNPLNLPQVNHINGNKLDNRVDNLEWCSASENIIHAHQCGLVNYKGERNGRCKLSDLTIESIREDFSIGLSRKYIAHKYGISYSHVVSVVSNKRR